jgi:hypothetical protein
MQIFISNNEKRSLSTKTREEKKRKEKKRKNVYENCLDLKIRKYLLSIRMK